jgi:hypothetical protein
MLPCHLNTRIDAFFVVLTVVVALVLHWALKVKDAKEFSLKDYELNKGWGI